MRIDGFSHNLLSVLLVPSFPIGLIGLLRLPWTGRIRALRPLLVVSLLTFWITTLFFPVATTWGTFLHAAGPGPRPADRRLPARPRCPVRRGSSAWRGWTKQVAWLGATLTIASAVLFSLTLGRLRRPEHRHRQPLPGPRVPRWRRSAGRSRPPAR